LAFELGTGDFEKLKKTFSTVLNIHIAIAILVVLLAETVGLWFVYHKLTIPADRMNAALWVYHLSILTTVFYITQVPYNASIVSHEKMGMFAYIGIVETLAKLGLVFLLRVGPFDKLIFYAVLIGLLHVCVVLFERFYCISKFKETHYEWTFDRNILKAVAGFSGWNLFANLSGALNSQGTTIITNMFFGPAVVTARSVAGLVNMTANQFVQNFRVAANPQIVKKYAAGDVNASKQLLLQSTKYSFYLMFVLGLPIILLARPVLYLWLGQVPEYSVIFLQLIVIQSLFSVFDSSFYVALYAKGRLREDALISPLVGFIQFPIIYVLFRLGYSPVVLSYAGIISYAILGLVIKPILLCRIADYDFREIINTFVSCFNVVIVSILVPVLCAWLITNDVLNFICVCFSSVISVGISVFYLGMSEEARNKIKDYVFNALKKRGIRK
jgi:O-antigen/teichoic acid export membrane protein